MLFLEGESVWRRTEGRCPLPEPCRGRCSGTLSTSQACTTGPPLKTTLQKQTEKGKGQRTLPSAPSLPGQPWGEGWVWKEVGPGGDAEAWSTPAAGLQHPKKAAPQRQVPQGLHRKPEAVVRMRKLRPAKQRQDITSSRTRDWQLRYLPGVSENEIEIPPLSIYKR